MLELAEIDRIAGAAASAILKLPSLSARAEPTAGSEGEDALLVTLVVPDPGYTAIDGDAALDAMLRIRQDLVNAGEERFPIVQFTTEKELSADVDPEP